MTNLTEICLHPPFTRVLPGLSRISGPTAPGILAGAGRLSNKPLKDGAIILQDYRFILFFFLMPLKCNTYMKLSLNPASFTAAGSTSAKQILKDKMLCAKSDSVQI